MLIMKKLILYDNKKHINAIFHMKDKIILILKLRWLTKQKFMKLYTLESLSYIVYPQNICT